MYSTDADTPRGETAAHQGVRGPSDTASAPDSEATGNRPKNRKKGGRPKGSRSKRNILIEQFGKDLEAGSVREIIFATFDLMGGLAGLLKWAEKHPDKFYRDLFIKMGPRSQGAGRPMTEPPTQQAGVVVEDFTGGE